MRIVCVLLTLFVTSRNSSIEKRIVGGVETIPFQYPWLLSIQISGKNICGGILINPTTLITAAHCSTNDLMTNLKVYAEKHRIRTLRVLEKGFKFKVIEIIQHPNYDPIQKRLDISIWRLKLVAGDSKKVPVDLIEFDDGSFSTIGTSLEIAGWGRLSFEDNVYPNRLMKGTVEVQSHKYCLKVNPVLDRYSICAGGHDYTGPCVGDSGGPLFYSDTESGAVVLVGIISYGIGCGDPKFPGVYTRISSVKTWISSYQN